MKPEYAIILAAGKTPNEKWTKFPEGSKPKCLHHVNGEVLLERNIKLLNKYGISNIIVVVGYNKDHIIDFVKEKKLNVKFVYNDSAHLTGFDPFVSFKLGFDEIPGGAFLLFMSDCICSEEYLTTLINCENDYCLNGGGQEIRIIKMNKDIMPDSFDIFINESSKYSYILPAHPFAIGAYYYMLELKATVLEDESIGIVEVDQFAQSDEGHPEGRAIYLHIEKLNF